MATIIMLVVMQLFVVGSIIANTRDQDMTAHRLDTLRAFYAAEAGANMAIRERFQSADEDGDGTVGTISDDDNDGNDPLLAGGSRVVVTAVTAGSDITHTSLGRSGSCRRRIGAVTQESSGGSGSGSTSVMMACSRNGSNQPRYITWNGSSWTANTAMPSIGGVAAFVVLKPCPTRSEVAFLATDDQSDVNVVFFNGTSWGSVTELCSDVGDTSDRPTDLAYEALSGDALMAYWKESSNQIGYRTWNGTSVSSESLLSFSGVSEVDYITLYSRPGTNDIIMIAMATGGSEKLAAIVWNGSSWGSWTTLTTTYASDDEECYSLAFESQSGTAIVVYGEKDQNSPAYRTWDGSFWSGESLMPTIGGEPRWLRVRADPTSDKVLMAALDKEKDVNVNAWSGSAWGSNSQFEDETDSDDRRQVDLAFERNSNRAIVAYREKNKNRPQYRVWNGSSWGSEQDGPNINRKMEVVQLTTGVLDGELFLAVSDDQRDVHVMRWSGTAWGSAQQPETDLGSSTSSESFMISGPSEGGVPVPTVYSWVESAP